MSVIRRCSDAPYQVAYSTEAIEKIANEVKNVPRDFINEQGNDVTEKMLTYLRPLIQGEPAITYKDGMPEFASLSHLY